MWCWLCTLGVTVDGSELATGVVIQPKPAIKADLGALPGRC